MATLTKGHTVGDFIQSEWDQRYCREGNKLKAPAGGLVVDEPVAFPLKVVSGNWQIVVAGDEANATHFLLWHKAINLGANEVSTITFPALARGPAIANEVIIPANDPTGSAYTLATLKGILTAMTPLVVRSTDSPNKSTQTT